MAHEIEYIEWIDAVATAGWQDRTQGFPVHTCHSVGVIVEEDEDHVTLAGTWSSQEQGDQVNCVISIPVAWIKNRGTMTVWK